MRADKMLTGRLTDEELVLVLSVFKNKLKCLFTVFRLCYRQLLSRIGKIRSFAGEITDVHITIAEFF